MPEQSPRWEMPEDVDDDVVAEMRSRLVHRFPAAATVSIARAWAGLYDMTPDAHPIIGPVAPGVYAACGFSGHGFMQAPAVGRIVADELLDGGSDFDLTPVPAGALRRRRRLPGDRDSLEGPGYESAPHVSSSTRDRRASSSPSSLISAGERRAPITSSHVAACVRAARRRASRPASVIVA